MATTVKVAGSLIPSTADTPLDQRSRVSTVEEILNIENPYLGMLVYCTGDAKTYQITALKEKQIGAITVPNAAVDTYSEFSGSSGSSGGTGGTGGTVTLPVVSATATTLAAGSEATADVDEITNDAGETEWVFSFGIPSGNDGTGGSSGDVTAANVSITDSGSYFDGETVEAALQEIGAELSGLNELLATAASNVEAI